MIEVKDLKKSFGPKLAVGGVTFNVAQGEVLGFLGPNGAGKSTTMRMITGFIPPTEGSVKIGGFDIVENPLPAKRLFGYLPENAPSYHDMTVSGFLEFAAEMRGLSGDAKKRAVGAAVEKCFLQRVIHQSVDTLSKGFRHRTCFAQSIIHDPQVLILDEPTDGLDPNQKHEIRTLIKEMGRTKAIIFSTHILEEVDAVCSRAIVIDRGLIVANGTPAELRGRDEKAGAVLARFAGGPGEARDARGKIGALGGVAKVDVVSESPIVVRVHPKEGWNGADLANSIGEMAAKERWTLAELRLEEGRLDEVFRSITLGDRAGGKEDRK
ncbi:MAG: ATP-binding cassette domain-containing protein [Verrucomicrobia bacterium]|nr:ATP-binding cassette domain-containing protein [Verrucomicrobiota bacterium]